MPQSHPETVLSPRSSLSSSPFSSASSIDSPLISDSISDWTYKYPRDSEHRSGNHRRRQIRSGIHSPASSGSHSLPSSASTSDSVPMTPWKFHPDLALPEAMDRRQGLSSDENPNFLDGDEAFDENNIPPLYLGHTRWKQTQGTPGHPPANLPGDRTNAHVDRTALNRKSRLKTKHTHRNIYYERHLCKLFSFFVSFLDPRRSLSARIWDRQVQRDF